MSGSCLQDCRRRTSESQKPTSDRSAGQRPPLSCRTSPPQGGRSVGAPAFANHQLYRMQLNAEAGPP
ncbi:hypothetical protein FJ425_25680 [Mesorhizobium sp. B2-7-2]|nr:hypothetical protein FJ425_25680 [Mesorhizobium sp. B2-7-2]